MNHKINIIGASGSGATTLASNLASNLNIPHYDVDSYYWKKSDPPFVIRNSLEDTRQKITNDLNTCHSWVLSGSVIGWADQLAAHFTHVVFIQLDKSIRMKRLIEREYQRYGDRIFPGGDMCTAHKNFINWASSYDDDNTEIKSKKIHEDWLAKIHCNIIRIDSQNNLNEIVQYLLRKIT